MGEARRLRQMKKKAEQRVSETRAVIDKINAKSEQQWTVLEKLRKEFDEVSKEYQEELWELCDIAGPEFFPNDSKEIARLMLDNNSFALGPSYSEEFKYKILPRLSYLLQKYIHDRTDRVSQGLEIMREAAKRDSDDEREPSKWDLSCVEQFFSSIYAQRMLHEQAATKAGHYVPFKKMDWAKHMTREEMVRAAKLGIEGYLKSYEAGLTGRAKRAYDVICALPAKGREEVERSLESDDEGDFSHIKMKASIGMDFHLEHDKRAETFMVLFDRVRKEMNRPYEDEDVDSVAYIITEKIFSEAYKDEASLLSSSYKIHDHLDKLPKERAKEVVDKAQMEIRTREETARARFTRIEEFNTRIRRMQENLTGQADVGKTSYDALPDDEKKALHAVVEDIPKSIIVNFERSLGEYLDNKGIGWDGLVDFGMIFEAIHDNAVLQEQKIAEHLKFAFSYLVTEKLLVAGFTESEYKKSGEKYKEDPYVAPPEKGMSSKELWPDAELTHSGMDIWEMTYKEGLGDEAVRDYAATAAEMWGKAAAASGVTVNTHRIAVAEAVFQFTAKWAVHAFQRITTTHTYAAALMCTDSSKEVLQDIEMQWHAFMVCLPNGLLKYEDEELGIESEYSRVLVASFEDRALMVLLDQNGEKSRNRLVAQTSSTLADLLDSGSEELVGSVSDIETKTKDKVRRIFTLSKRLVAGLLLALQNQNNFKSRVSPARDRGKSREREEPAHRVVFVGSPLNVDCRPQVKDYISNGSPKRKGVPPSVQYLVRGHHKRQVVGVGRTGRKVIWVSPYWKGPEDAPIFTRPRKVVG